MQDQNLAVKSKSTSNGKICVQNAARVLNLSESQALPKDQILARSSRASSSQNRSQILNVAKAKTSSENPTQSPKNRSNLISLNAAKGSCFTSGANLQQPAPSAADQDALLAEFKEFLAAHLPSNPSFHPCFDEALSYTLKSGGKHFRAMLV
ncbi:MAG: polyprenyl synthetase family protein, partial [Campylobacter sp.]